jgi:hypothetical protein
MPANEQSKAFIAGRIIASVFGAVTTKIALFGFCGFLAYLKVVHGADLSWVWVFAPFWLPMAIVLGVFGILFVIAIIATIAEAY